MLLAKVFDGDNIFCVVGSPEGDPGNKFDSDGDNNGKKLWRSRFCSSSNDADNNTELSGAKTSEDSDEIVSRFLLWLLGLGKTYILLWTLSDSVISWLTSIVNSWSISSVHNDTLWIFCFPLWLLATQQEKHMSDKGVTGRPHVCGGVADDCMFCSIKSFNS